MKVVELLQRWLEARHESCALSPAEQALLADPERLAKVDDALAHPEQATEWQPSDKRNIGPFSAVEIGDDFYIAGRIEGQDVSLRVQVVSDGNRSRRTIHVLLARMLSEAGDAHSHPPDYHYYSNEVDALLALGPEDQL